MTIAVLYSSIIRPVGSTLWRTRSNRCFCPDRSRQRLRAEINGLYCC